MFISTFASLLWFELGSWFGFGVAKFGSRDRNRNILIQGASVRTSIPIADGYIEKQTIHANWMQRKAASRLGKIIRAFVNTRAFELLVLQKMIESWPGRAPISAEIKVVLS